MRAAVYELFQGPISIQNIPDPKPSKSGVVVKVAATGLCRSDWHGWMGHDQDIVLPHVPGHELAGEIVEVGKQIKKLKVGDRVTVPFVSGCGRCTECQTGNQQVCDHQFQPGFTAFGSFAEYVSLEYGDLNVVKLPDEIDDITAATLGCRFITSFRAIVAQGNVNEGEKVAIHGCGGVGLSAIMIAKSLGAEVVAVDINEENLKLAKELGADYLINAKQEEVIDAVKSYSNGGVHVSLDALGSQETCFNSLLSLKKRGKHIQVGLMTNDQTHPKIPMDKIIANEWEIIGSHGMQSHKYPEMLQMIVDGKLSPEKLIGQTINLENACKQLPLMNTFKMKGVSIITEF
jgi:alcohol dehydrogenase